MLNKTLFKNSKNSRGEKFNLQNKSFTLLEVIIAISLIVIGIVGVSGLITQVLSAVNIASSKLVAIYLCQEGIEIVRNIRDTNWLKGGAWNEGLASGDYEADYDDPNLTSCSSPCNYANLHFLKIDGGFYNYDSGTETRFTRKITITPEGNDILKVSVEVFWQERGRSHRLSAQENLYNWK